MNLLEQIVASRRASLARARAARTLGPPGGGSGTPRVGDDVPASAPRDFEAALRLPGRRVIAEIKRRSPSAGTLRDDLDPRLVAASYEGAGAAALSVLTEPEFFGGSDADLVAARGAVSLAVLRKDFVVDREQVEESRRLGADAILLLVAALSPAELTVLHRAAKKAGLAVLIEVHGEEDLGPALDAGATLVGVNSRDLRDFSVDLARAERMASKIPREVLRVAESGIRTSADVARLEQAGFTAFLVGESLLRAPDPGGRLRELFA